MDDLGRAIGQDARDPLVVVLIHDDDAQRPVTLRIQGVEETSELIDSPDRRDDEVERRELAWHGP